MKTHSATFTSVDNDNLETRMQVKIKLDAGILITLDFNNKDECERMKAAFGPQIFYQDHDRIIRTQSIHRHVLALFTNDIKLASFFINRAITHKPGLKGIIQMISHFGLELHDAYQDINDIHMSIAGIKDEFAQGNGNERRIRVWHFKNTQENPHFLLPSSQDNTDYLNMIQAQDVITPAENIEAFFIQLLLPKADAPCTQEISSVPISYTGQLNAHTCFLTWLTASLCAYLPSRWPRDLHEDEIEKVTQIQTDTTKLHKHLNCLKSSIIYDPNLYQDQVDALFRNWQKIRSLSKNLLNAKRSSDFHYNQLIHAYEALTSKILELESIHQNVKNQLESVPTGKCLVLQYSVNKGGVQFKLEDRQSTNTSGLFNHY